MDQAINKSTGEMVSAFEVHENGPYQNLTKGEWTAPDDSISNLDENLSKEDLYVHYVREKEYENYRDNKIKIHSFSSELKYGGAKFVKKLRHVIEEQCRYLDQKIKETEIAKEELDEKKEEVIKEILERLNSRETILFNKIKSLEGNPFEPLVEKYKEEISMRINNSLNKLENLQEKFNPRVMPCKKCNQEYMVFKITPTKKKELYECQFCKEVIWVK